MWSHFADEKILEFKVTFLRPVSGLLTFNTPSSLSLKCSLGGCFIQFFILPQPRGLCTLLGPIAHSTMTEESQNISYLTVNILFV